MSKSMVREIVMASVRRVRKPQRPGHSEAKASKQTLCSQLSTAIRKD